MELKLIAGLHMANYHQITLDPGRKAGPQVVNFSGFDMAAAGRGGYQAVGKDWNFQLFDLLLDSIGQHRPGGDDAGDGCAGLLQGVQNASGLRAGAPDQGPCARADPITADHFFDQPGAEYAGKIIVVENRQNIVGSCGDDETRRLHLRQNVVRPGDPEAVAFIDPGQQGAGPVGYAGVGYADGPGL